MEVKFNQKPVLTIWLILTFPELKIMALGGVATGNMNAQEDANTAPTINL